MQDEEKKESLSAESSECQASASRAVPVNISEQLGFERQTSGVGQLFKLHLQNQRAQMIRNIEADLQGQINMHLLRYGPSQNRNKAICDLLYSQFCSPE